MVDTTLLLWVISADWRRNRYWVSINVGIKFGIRLQENNGLVVDELGEVSLIGHDFLLGCANAGADAKRMQASAAPIDRPCEHASTSPVATHGVTRPYAKLACPLSPVVVDEFGDVTRVDLGLGEGEPRFKDHVRPACVGNAAGGARLTRPYAKLTWPLSPIVASCQRLPLPDSAERPQQPEISPKACAARLRRFEAQGQHYFSEGGSSASALSRRVATRGCGTNLK